MLFARVDEAKLLAEIEAEREAAEKAAKKMEKPFTNTSKKMLDEIRSHIEMEAANAD